MPRFGLVGPTYESQSPNFDAQRVINFYPEVDESGAGNSPIALLSSPGTKQFALITPFVPPPPASPINAVSGQLSIVANTASIIVPFTPLLLTCALNYADTLACTDVPFTSLQVSPTGEMAMGYSRQSASGTYVTNWTGNGANVTRVGLLAFGSDPTGPPKVVQSAQTVAAAVASVQIILPAVNAHSMLAVLFQAQGVSLAPSFSVTDNHGDAFNGIWGFSGGNKAWQAYVVLNVVGGNTTITIAATDATLPNWEIFAVEGEGGP